MRLLLLILLFPVFANSETVFVLEAKGAGVSETDLKAITELVESSVVEEGYSLSQNRWKSDLELRTKLTRLGSSYILTVYKSKDKKTLYSQKMKSKSIEDMDTVVARVVRAVLKEENAKSNSKAFEVTAEEETKSQRRYQALQQWSYGLGYSVTSNLNDDASRASFSVGRNWNVDPKFDLGLEWDFYFGDATFYNVSIDVIYYKSLDKNAVNFIGGVGYGAAAADDGNFISDERADGLSLKAGVGMRFFRNSTVNLGVRATHQMILKDINGSSPGMSTIKLVIFY